jgi:hypothetical protein
MFEPSFEQQDVAWSLILRQFPHETFPLVPAKSLLRGLDLPLGDVERQASKIGAGAPIQQRAALDTINGRKRGRSDVDLDPATATRVEAMADKLCLNPRSHAVNDRQEDLADKIERRSQHIVRATLQHQAGWFVGENQRHENGLQDKPSGTSRPYRKMIVPRDHAPWPEGQFG